MARVEERRRLFRSAHLDLEAERRQGSGSGWQMEQTRQYQMGGMVKSGGGGAIVRVWGYHQGEGNGWSVF